MPIPIEPSPHDGDTRLGASGMRQFPGVLPARNLATALPLGITAWPRCQSMRQGGKEGAAMTENRGTRGICRLARSLFERGLTPGLLGQYQRQV